MAARTARLPEPEHGVAGSRTPPCSHGSRLDTCYVARPGGTPGAVWLASRSRPAIDTGRGHFLPPPRVRAVDFVADNWVPEVGEVYANLVGSAGFRFGFNEGKLLLLVLEPVQDPERSKGRIAVGVDRLLQPDPGWQNGSLPQERLIHDVGFFGGPAEDDGSIGFADAMPRNHEA